MSAANLAMYAEVALVLFLAAFLVVAYRVVRSGNREYDSAGRIPLEEEPVEPRYSERTEHLRGNDSGRSLTEEREVKND